MNLANFVEGLSILRAHYAKPDGYHLGAEHDQIFLYPTDTALSDQEVGRLVDLGWFQPEQRDGDGYAPDEGWSAFV